MPAPFLLPQNHHPRRTAPETALSARPTARRTHTPRQHITGGLTLLAASNSTGSSTRKYFFTFFAIKPPPNVNLDGLTLGGISNGLIYFSFLLSCMNKAEHSYGALPYSTTSA